MVHGAHRNQIVRRVIDALTLRQSVMMEVIGPRAYLLRESPEAALQGQLAGIYTSLLILTFGGGTNEVQRDLIGLFGLGLPRVPRM